MQPSFNLFSCILWGVCPTLTSVMSLQMTLTEMNCQGMIVAQHWSEKRTIKERKSQERRQALFFKMLPELLLSHRLPAGSHTTFQIFILRLHYWLSLSWEILLSLSLFFLWISNLESMFKLPFQISILHDLHGKGDGKLVHIAWKIKPFMELSLVSETAIFFLMKNHHVLFDCFLFSVLNALNALCLLNILGG